MCRANSYHSGSTQYYLGSFIYPVVQQSFIEHCWMGEIDDRPVVIRAVVRDIISLRHVSWTEVPFGRWLAFAALSPTLITFHLQDPGSSLRVFCPLSTLLWQMGGRNALTKVSCERIFQYFCICQKWLGSSSRRYRDKEGYSSGHFWAPFPIAPPHLVGYSTGFQRREWALLSHLKESLVGNLTLAVNLKE